VASPKLGPVVLTDDERSVLNGWARRRKTAQALAFAVSDRAGLRGAGRDDRERVR
jgi:hypothetical protein